MTILGVPLTRLMLLEALALSAAIFALIVLFIVDLTP